MSGKVAGRPRATAAPTHSPDQRFDVRLGPPILAGALGLALALGRYLGEDGNLMVVGAGFVVLILGIVVLSVPLLGLAAIVVVIASNASNNFIHYFDLPSVAKLMLPCTALLLGYRWIGHGERPLFEKSVAWLFGGYAALMLLSIPFAIDWTPPLGAISDFLKDAIVVLFIVAFFSRAQAMSVLFLSLFATALFLCTLVLYKYNLGNPYSDYYGFARTDNTSRVPGPIGDPNYFGAFLVIFLSSSLYYLVYAKRILVRGLAAYGVLAVLVCIFLTQSRGALVALIVMAGVALLAFDRKIAIRLAVLFILFGGVSALVLSEQLLQRFSTIFLFADADSVLDKSIQGRLAQWSVALHLFLDHPIFGVGAGNYNIPFQDYSLDLGLMFRDGEARAAHSLYLEVLAERGLVGFAWLATMLAYGILGVRRAVASAAAAKLDAVKGRYLCLGIGLAGHFTALAFLHDAYPRLMWMMLAIAIALPSVAAVEIAARTDAR